MIGPWVVEKLNEFNLSYHHEGKEDHHFYGATQITRLLINLHEEEISRHLKKQIEDFEVASMAAKKEILAAIGAATPEQLKELGIVTRLSRPNDGCHPHKSTNRSSADIGSGTHSRQTAEATSPNTEGKRGPGRPRTTPDPGPESGGVVGGQDVHVPDKPVQVLHAEGNANRNTKRVVRKGSGRLS